MSDNGRRYVWVVECLDGHSWMPTWGIGKSREEGRGELVDYRRMNPNDKFRLVVYVPAEKP